ncbi:MAG: beta-glucosidase, partial [Ruminococcaceae bacterium]|nr:beta-glucosidase [Oscillospiraceae bacterium]
MTEQQLRALLSDMSLAEKFGELQQMPGQYYTDDCIETGVNAAFDFTEEEAACIGSTLNVLDPARINEIQKQHIARHPHGIPMLFMLDIIHGYSTVYPIPLAQACSFDPDLVRALARATARESCAAGQHVTFSPMVDIARDARWGRVMEGNGEDPYLGCKMAEAAVQGYQGDDLTAEGTISACVKHFAAYGAVEGGREYGHVDMSERILRQYYLPPYKAACDAGSGMLMTAFNAIAGVPASGSRELNAILRDEWGYDGTVISDYGSVSQMYSHGVIENATQSTKRAMDGGVDIEMCIHHYRRGLPQLLADGELTEEQLDRAVWRVLNLKNRLGLFENPYRFASPEKATQLINCAEFLQLAREAVPRCSVLLKNEDTLLPLSPAAKETVAFIGPFLNEHDLLGGWVNGRVGRIATATLQETLQARYPDRAFTYTAGCELLGAEDAVMASKKKASFESDEDRRRTMLEAAVRAAEKADTVVLFLGEHPQCGGEMAAKADIRLPKIQRDLFEAVAAVNPNIVTVVFDHRPVELGAVATKSKALLNVWFPGTMGAAGITDMLFGDTAPTGRTTMSFPHTVGQEPIYYNRLPTDHAPEFSPIYITGYIDCPLEPLFSFGEGLTYTDFAYGEVRLDTDILHEGETLIAAVTVKNVGKRDGEETVQLYIRDRFASVSQPVKELK